MVTSSWTDLIGENLDVGDGVSGIISSCVCKLMSQVVKLTDELVIGRGGGGSCTSDEIDGLTTSCEFLLMLMVLVTIMRYEVLSV